MGKQATGLGPASAWDETGVDDVDIKRQVHRLCSLPGKFQRGLDDFLHADAFDIADGHHGGAAGPSDLHPGPRSLPPADTDLHEVRCRSVGDVCGVEPRCRVHPFVEIEFLSVDVAVEVDDADVPVDVGGESTDGWVANGMVATENHWENACDATWPIPLLI